MRVAKTRRLGPNLLGDHGKRIAVLESATVREVVARDGRFAEASAGGSAI